MGNVVVPQAALEQGKVVAVLSQATNPLWPLGCVIAHCQTPVGGVAAQLPPFGLAEQEQGESKVAPTVQVETCFTAKPAGQSKPPCTKSGVKQSFCTLVAPEAQNSPVPPLGRLPFLRLGVVSLEKSSPYQSTRARAG